MRDKHSNRLSNRWSTQNLRANITFILFWKLLAPTAILYEIIAYDKMFLLRSDSTQLGQITAFILSCRIKTNQMSVTFNAPHYVSSKRSDISHAIKSAVCRCEKFIIWSESLLVKWPWYFYFLGNSKLATSNINLSKAFALMCCVRGCLD